MSIRNRSRKFRDRAVSAALVVALVLLLTPRCELFAALHQSGAPANAAAAHILHDDEHQLPAGEHCAPWLEQVYMPASTMVLPAVDPQGGIDAVAPARVWPGGPHARAEGRAACGRPAALATRLSPDLPFPPLTAAPFAARMRIARRAGGRTRGCGPNPVMTDS